MIESPIQVTVEEATDQDLDDVLLVEREAFGSDDEAALVCDLLADASAKPVLSLLARQGGRPAGHVLFTAARLEGCDDVSSVILAPLAVVPERQRQGIGGELIARGLELLSTSGVDLVFVLGHPEYYPRHGFEPAGRLGLQAPFPIPDDKSDAWMVQALRPHLLGSVRGVVNCADAMSKPECWRE